MGLGMAAALSGVARSTLRSWENGESRPRGPALARLLDALEAEPRLRARILQAADPAYARLELTHSPLGAPVDVGTVLRAMRARRGLTQADLARRVGVTQGTVSHWEVGESLPSAETIHAAGFALGATAEETVALAGAQGTGRAGLPEDLQAAHARVGSPGELGPLYEVVSLGWEAELWRRAAQDPQWDACLIRVLADRANWLVVEERYDDAAVPARRAVGMARNTEEIGLASPAVAALADFDRRRGYGHAAAAEMAGAWAARLPDSLYRAWMLRQRGMCLARMGRGDEGAGLVGRSTEMDFEFAPVGPASGWSLHAQRQCEARLASGEPAKAAALLEGRIERSFSPLVRVGIEHANGRAATDAEMAYLRYWVGADLWNPQHRRKLERAERRQAWRAGSEPVPTTPCPPDQATSDRLWAAVLREHRG